MTRKYGVSLDVLGNLIIEEQRLKRYTALLECCKEDAVTKFKFSIKYPGYGWNIYEDKEFLENTLYPELETTLDWLLENNIYPEDLLEKRKPRIYMAELGKINLSIGEILYVIPFDLPYFSEIIQHDTSKIYNGLINKLKYVTAWRLRENKDGEILCIIININWPKRKKLGSGKLMTELGMNQIIENSPHIHYRFYTKPWKIQETGVKIKIETEYLGKYDPLRYILEKGMENN